MSKSTRFAILATPETTPTALYALFEILVSVGRTWEQVTGERAEAPHLDPMIVTRDGLPIVGAHGVPIAPHDGLVEADVVIVTDLLLPQPFDPDALWAEEFDWLRKRHAAGSVICSVCTGSVMLAASGLLDGHEATTHWSVVDLIKERFPKVKLSPQRILTASGPGHQIVTAGGSTSWTELALYLVARFSSGAEAVRISKIFLLGDRSDGQLPFAGARRPRKHDDGAIGPVQEWLADNYHMPNPVSRMVEISGLSERSFIRRFHAATGYRPMEYVQTLRIEEAKQVLESTQIPIEDIANEVGYEDSNFFRRLFKRTVGVTPAKYRQKFASIAKPALL
jgi:transcriptional regulator GlxA family with amidase domain